MTLTINRSVAKGKISAPPSKSMAHRLLISAALCGEKCEISNVAFSKDIEATVSCLNALGANCEEKNGTVTVSGKLEPQNGAELHCGESGSTLRFMLPICLLFGKEITLKGAERLFERPLGIYEEIAQREGFLFKKSKTGVTVCGKLQSGEYTVPGDVSSQFISGLMFALSKLENNSRIILSTELKSRPYVDMTVKALAEFGVTVIEESNGFLIKGGTFLPRNMSVEGDWSNAAFLDAFNLIGGEVEVTNLKDDSLQGDKIYREYYKLLQSGRPTLDINDCPDLGPVLISAAALLNGAVLTGTDRLKIKESDRGAAMRQELLKMGAEIEIGDNFIKIPDCELHSPSTALSSHNDHRIAMALSLILTKVGGSIEGWEAVAKSYPDYFEGIASLGIEVETVNGNQ